MQKERIFSQEKSNGKADFEWKSEENFLNSGVAMEILHKSSFESKVSGEKKFAIKQAQEDRKMLRFINVRQNVALVVIVPCDVIFSNCSLHKFAHSTKFLIADSHLQARKWEKKT